MSNKKPTVEMTQMIQALEETGEWGPKQAHGDDFIIRSTTSQGGFLMLKHGDPFGLTYHKAGDSSDTQVPAKVQEIYTEIYKAPPGPFEMLVESLVATREWWQPQISGDRCVLRNTTDRGCLLIVTNNESLKMEIFRSGESSPSPVPAHLAQLRGDTLRRIAEMAPTGGNASAETSLKFYLVIGYLETSSLWTRLSSVKRVEGDAMGSYRHKNGDQVMVICSPGGDPYVSHHPDANKSGSFGKELARMRALIGITLEE